ncbi:MAG: site-specific DNA-methyltransferase [Candidatus Mycalebacterium zealandia]|nr:MAG: site-specific DNA-methyltransferase [Candidatus Mycalebacterium zealandia]
MSSLNTAIVLSEQEESQDLIAIRQASVWASRYLNKNVTTSNISYLIQYGRISRYGENGTTLVSKAELVRYYEGFHGNRETNWKEKLGDDLNWLLSFDFLKEKDTTKHVHRLHPYKGKFIPQLVEYFLDSNTDEFKRETFFQPGDIVLDPFCGSGTTLVQANELGMHAIGIDVSAFNALISNAKVSKHNLNKLQKEIDEIRLSFERRIKRSKNRNFEQELLEELNIFNSKYFPSPDFKKNVRTGEINEKVYCFEKEKEFMPIFDKLVKRYRLQIEQKKNSRFLEKWFLKPVRNEIEFLFKQVGKVQDKQIRAILGIALSRTVRSCRATTHADLATLKSPVTKPYYCRKHGKICKPLFSVNSWWNRYSEDTVNRLKEFEDLRTQTSQICLQGDSRKLNLASTLSKRRKHLAERVKKDGVKGIFTSPPYVGLIDYHEQHAYAYDLFAYDRNDGLEIGPLSKGQGALARQSYIESIAEVLCNCRKYLVDDFNVFIVANDKYNLYPSIAGLADMQIVKRYKRPVLNRTEKDKAAYSEIIFHLKSVE